MLHASKNFHRCLVAAAISLAAVIVGCQKNAASQAAAPARPPASVTAVAAIEQDVPVYIDAIGKTVATEVVSIIPQVAGKVVAAHVEDGAYVTKGQLLFEIDPRPFQAALASAEATLAQNQAEYAWAQADFKRTDELHAQGVASQLEFDQKKSTADADKAKIDAAQADIETAQLNLEYTKIYSPLDGRAGVRLVDAGNVVKANEGVMLTIQRMDPIYAEFTVTENDLGTVRKYMVSHGMQVGNEQSLGLKALVDVPGDSAELLTALSTGSTTQPAKQVGPREGTVTFLDNSVQNQTGTVKLRAALPNADHYFWPGQFVKVRLVLTIKKDAVLIPVAAQQIGQQGPYVYVVKEGDVENPQTHAKTPATIAELRPIVPGQRQGDLVVVEQGVQPGERVIVAGQMTVAPNGPVMVTNAAQPAPTTQTAMK